MELLDRLRAILAEGPIAGHQKLTELIAELENPPATVDTELGPVEIEPDSGTLDIPPPAPAYDTTHERDMDRPDLAERLRSEP